MTHRSRHPKALLAALVGGLLLLAGCATIPTQTEPVPLALSVGADQNAQAAVPQPPPGATPADIVQDWVRYGGNPVGKHAAARAYLADSAKNSWNDTASLTVVADNPVIAEPAPSPVGTPANERIVTLSATNIGQLGPDNAFQPQFTQLVMPITVQKQRNGEWRIVQPPDGVVLTQSEFATYYRAVRIYFFDPPLGALVPDLRYIANDPGGDQAARVIDELLSGPSNAMANALRSAIPSNVTTKTVPAEQSDGAIQVNLHGLPEEPAHTKQLIIGQIVQSLHEISPSPVLIQSESTPLIPEQPEWVVGELPSYNATTTPNAGQPGLLATHGKVYSLKDGSPVAGGAGDGSYDVITGAQSEDGSELALVCQGANGAQLRVGNYGKSDPPVQLQAGTLTRPTWAPGQPGAEASNEVWTVADGQFVDRVLQTQQGNWVANNVDATALSTYGQITSLRLSRDGTRVAAIAGGHLLVGAVVPDQQNQVAIKQVVQLQAQNITKAVDVDWLDQTNLAVATAQPGQPVFMVSVDGLSLNKYAANLTVPTAITAAQARPVLVADSAGIWMTSDTADLWEVMSIPHDPGTPAIPFYPG
ncbi:MAG TPA: LpqB family beta-propeller domain-containing protein [Pseudonocardiaceae bacterium]|jgi:hypothetical protein